MTNFCCIFSFLVILILIVYSFFYHDIQMDFSQIVNDFTCSLLIVFAFFYIPQCIYSLICFGVFFMLTPMDISLFFVNWRMTFTLVIACLFKTSRMLFTTTSMIFFVVMDIMTKILKILVKILKKIVIKILMRILMKIDNTFFSHWFYSLQK